MGWNDIPDHPEIECIERTGYPSWMQERDEDYERDSWDDAYDERREAELFGDDY